MNRKHLHGAFLLAAASLLAVGAYAQNPNAAPQAKANAADKAERANATDKGKPDKDAKDKADKDAKEPGAAKGKSVEDRAERRAKEHEAQRQRLASMLKAPMTDAIKQELRRHAERVARLERIKAVAEAEKDKDSVEKATKLLAKENERHEKWMEKHATAAATPAPCAVPAAAGESGGVK